MLRWLKPLVIGLIVFIIFMVATDIYRLGRP